MTNTRSVFALASLLALAGCATKTVRVAAPPPLPTSQTGVSAPVNFELVVEEAVESAEADGLSYTKIFIDGKEAGRTDPGPRSKTQTRSWYVSPGNRPFRFERWLLPGLGEWAPMPEDRQPRERFLRIEDRGRTRVRLRFYEHGRKVDYAVSREG